MNKVARKGLVTAMVAGGVLAPAGFARADASAGGTAAGSPGVLSGNSIQLPVHIPLNVCGNTIDVVGLLNPAAGNACVNSSQHVGSPAPVTGARPGRPADGPAARGGSSSGGGAHAVGLTEGSPGVLSGNGLQLPVDLPVNVSGNSVNVVGVGNPAVGNTAVNQDTVIHTRTVTATPRPPAHRPVPAPPNEPRATGHEDPVALAHTGADGLGYAAGGSAVMLLGGALLYRRFGPGRR